MAPGDVDITVDPCGPHKPLNITDGEPGNITSPYYPGTYQADAFCGWFIKADDGMVVGLTISSFETEETLVSPSYSVSSINSTVNLDINLKSNFYSTSLDMTTLKYTTETKRILSSP